LRGAKFAGQDQKMVDQKITITGKCRTWKMTDLKAANNDTV